MQIDDATLTDEGLPPQGEGRVLIIACGALAREILALVAANGWTHLDLQCLPAILHNTPDKIPDAVTAAITAHGADYGQVFVAYADCGTGGLLQKRCADLGVEMIEGPHCYSFFEGNEAFAAQALAVSKELGFDPARVNPNGGAVALGHPVGATGAIITVKAMYELDRTGGKRALITMCIGGGQGIALAIERV